MTGACSNCGSSDLGEFCAACGQKTPRPSDYSLRELGHAAVGWLTNYDSRLLTTVRALLLRPGQLARDHFEGRRARHLDPFRIFLLANILAWLIVPHTLMRGFSVAYGRKYAMLDGTWERLVAVRAALHGIPVEQMLKRIDAAAGSVNTLAVLSMVPLGALMVELLLARRGFRYVQHLVFMAHVYCIQLLCVLLYIGFILVPVWTRLGSHAETKWLADLVGNLWAQHFAVAPALLPYVYLGLRRAYGLTAVESSWRAVLVTAWSCTLARTFFDLAFAIAIIVC